MRKLLLLTSILTYVQLNCQNSFDLIQDSSVTKGQLRNGLIYYIQKNTNPRNKVYIQMIVGTGALNENNNEKGLAHFLEHLAFNGTRKYKKMDLDAFLEKNNLKIGSDYNAYTTHYNTTYYLTIDYEKELFEKSIEILKEWAFEIEFTPEEIEKERGVILSEKNSKEDAKSMVSKNIFNSLIQNSIFYNNPVIGNENLIKSFKKEQFQSFYRKWYVPNNIQILIVGDVSTSEAESLIKKYFDRYVSKEIKLEFNDSIGWVNHDTILEFHNEFLMTNSKVSAYWNIHKQKISNQDLDYKEDMIFNLFNKMIQNRIKQINDTLINKINISFSLQKNIKEYSVSSYMSTSSDTNIDHAVYTLLNFIQNIKENSFNQEELDFAVGEVREELNRTKIENENRSSKFLISRLNYKLLRKERMLSNADKLILDIKHIDEITIHDIDSFCRQLQLNMPKKWIYEFKSPTKKTPINDLLKNYSYDSTFTKNRIDTFQIKELVTISEPKGSIVSRLKDSFNNTRTLRLNNGNIVILKQNNSFKNKVFFQFSTLRDSLYHTEKKEYQITLYNTMPLGTKIFRQKYLSKYWKKHFINYTFLYNKNQKTGKGSLYSDQIKYALELFYFINSPMNGNKIDFDLIKQKMLRVIEKEDSTKTEFQDKMYHAKYTEEFQEKSKITKDKLIKYTLEDYDDVQKESLKNNQHIIAIVGDFDPDTLDPLIQKYLASTPTFQNNLINQNFKKSIYKFKSDSIYTININESLHFFKIELYNKILFEQADDVNLFSSIFKNILNKKLKDVIREEKGQIYTSNTRSHFNYSRDSILFFEINIKTNKTHAIEVKKEIKEILNDFRNGHFERLHFDNEKNYLKKYLERILKTNEEWANKLIEDYIEKKDVNYELLKRLKTFDSELFESYLKRFFTNEIEIFGEKGK